MSIHSAVVYISVFAVYIYLLGLFEDGIKDERSYYYCDSRSASYNIFFFFLRIAVVV